MIEALLFTIGFFTGYSLITGQANKNVDKDADFR